jgi:hypothetical protein
MALYILSNAYRKPVNCLIRVGTGRRLITEPFAFVQDVLVHCRRNEATVAMLRLTARRAGNQQVTREAGLFGAGEPIVIEADFGKYCEELMRGSVHALKASYEQGTQRRPTTVTVECQDDSLRLDRECMHRVWGGGEHLINDRFVVATLLEEYGLKLDPASGAGSHYAQLIQDATDLDFLRARAAVNGYDLLFQAGQVYFGPMRLVARPQGRIQADRRLSAQCRYFCLHTDAEAGIQQAQGELNGRCYGRVLRVGEPVQVDSVGEPYNGLYYVEGVLHRFSATDGYQQFFTLLRGSGAETVSGIKVVWAATTSPLYDVL